MTVILLASTLTLICGATYLLRYRSARVEDELLEISHSSGKTEFYRFDYHDRQSRLGNAILIENASLDSGIKYKYTSYDEIPQNLINAFVAIEDKRFYQHSGVDLLRTGMAAMNYVFGSGEFGGSTITQQLVKNLTGRDEFSVDRKLTEAFCALDIEERCDKTEILEMYMNVINLSEGCRGIGAAAELYYSKAPKDLTLSQCATIAAITNNPARYDPIKHPENNLKRRNLILKCMLEQDFISQNEYDLAVSEPITLDVSSAYGSGCINSWYVDMVTEDVINDLSAKYSVSKSSAALMLYRGGYRIYTAMDKDIQAILDEYYKDVYNFPIDSQGNMPQSSMIVIDPYSGDILGVAGAVGEKTGNRLQNYATDTKRPPGSTIKPLTVYAPALQGKLINWATIVEDSPVITDKNTAWPSNVTDTYVGNVDIKYAIEHSLNTVAVKVLQTVGEQEAFTFLHDKLLIKSLDSRADMGAASLALGQPSHGVTLREITAAYSIFEEGIMSKPRSYFKVTDSSGRVILDNTPHEEAVLSRETAAIMTKLLETVVDTGTASGKIALDDRIDVAGKSGTSQSNHDRCFIGYTPELLAGVWFGYEYPKDLSEFGGNVSVYLWDEVMTAIYDRTEYGKIKRFKTPETVQRLTYDAKTGELPPNNASSELAEGWFESHISQ